MVLGGLVTRSDNSATTRVPLLSDLPVIGQFFRGRDRSIVENELLIFVTATILDEEEGMGVALAVVFRAVPVITTAGMRYAFLQSRFI
jgi:type II secretory pathway component GspD/PulD (secretin)